MKDMCERKQGGCFTYILRCLDGTFYTGWTNHVEQRLRAHNEGRGARYTRSRRPVELVYLKEFDTKEQAMSEEWRIKQLPRKKKLDLIEAGAAETAAYRDLSAR